MSSSAADKSPIERVLDAGVYRPLGFLITRDQDCDDLALAGRKQVAFARSLGRAALKGISRGLRAPEPVSGPVPVPEDTPAPAAFIEGYGDMTARDIITRLRTATPEQAQWVSTQETAGKQRVTVLRAAAALVPKHGSEA